jgi:hypothetical protein
MGTSTDLTTNRAVQDVSVFNDDIRGSRLARIDKVILRSCPVSPQQGSRSQDEDPRIMVRMQRD